MICVCKCAAGVLFVEFICNSLWVHASMEANEFCSWVGSWKFRKKHVKSYFSSYLIYFVDVRNEKKKKNV